LPTGNIQLAFAETILISGAFIYIYLIRVIWEKGSGFAFGAGLAACGAPKTFQNLSVSSAAAVATVQPSGLCKRFILR